MNRYLEIAVVLFSAQVLMKQQQAAPRFSAITAGDEFTCALDSDGKAWCLGANEYGQVGARTTDQCRGVMFVRRDSCQLVPIQVVGEKRFHIIDAGSSHVSVTSLTWGVMHACALAKSGAAYCWGDNGAGALGNGSKRSGVQPEPIDTRRMH